MVSSKSVQEEAPASVENGLALFDKIGQAMLLRDAREDKIVQANQAASALFGYPAGVLTGKPVAALMADAGQEETEEDVRLLFLVRRGESQRYERRIRQPSGALRWVEIHLSRIALASGEYLLFLIHDIEARKQAEQSDADEAALTRAMDTLAIVADTSGRVYYMNPAARKRLGINRPALDDLSYVELIPGWAQQVLLHGILGDTERHADWRGELALLDGDRREFTVELLVLRQPRDANGISRFTLLAQDVSVLRRRELALKRAKQDAESANHIRGQFLKNVSQTIQPPARRMARLIGLLQAMEPSSPEQRDCTSLLSEHCSQISRFVDDVASYLDAEKI